MSDVRAQSSASRAQSWPTGVVARAAARATIPRTQGEEQVARPQPAGVQGRDGGRVHEPLAHPQPGQVGAGQPGTLPVEELLEGGVRADPDDDRRLRGVARAAARRPRWSPRSRPGRRGRRSARGGRPGGGCRGRRGPRRSWAARRVAAAGKSPASELASTTTTSGRRPADRMMSAPPSTPIRIGRRSFTNARIARRSRRWSWPSTTTTTGRPEIRVPRVGRPWPWRSRSSSRRRNSALLWVKLWSWEDSPVRARPSSPSRTCCVDLAAQAHGVAADVHDLVVHPHRGAVRDPVDPLQPVHQHDAGLEQQGRPQRRVPAGEERRLVQDRRHPGIDQRLRGRAVEVELVDDGDVAGPQPRQQHLGPPVDAGGTGEAGQADVGSVADGHRLMISAAPGGGPHLAPLGASGPGAGRERGLEQLAGVGEGVVGLAQPGHHPRQLPLPRGVVEHGQT